MMARYRKMVQERDGFVSVLRFVYVAQTQREAQEHTRRTIARYAHYDCGITWDGRTDTKEYADLLQRLHAIIGTPDQVIAQLQACQREAYFEEVMCQVYAAGMHHENSLRSIQLLGHEVLPYFRC
jgi:alkanesulfonate monooxygenase SsuD/methylene tetrahydromethanopterin reductase-like flavin-dependent oxidoreductase (luciferase family)